MFFSTLDEIPATVIHHHPEYDRQNIDGINNIIAFSSGRDKAGKTTIAVNLAVMLAKTGLKIGLLDAESNSDRSSEILGIKAQDTFGSQEIFEPASNFGVKLVFIGSLIDEDPLEDWCDEWCDYWLNRELKRILEGVQWGNLDYLIVNLPPGRGDIQIALAQALPLNGVVMVTTNKKEADSEIYKTLKMFEQLKVPIFGLIENKCNLISADLSRRKREIKDSKSNQKIRVPFLGYVPLEPTVSQYKSRGLPIVIAEPSSMFTSALQIVVWAISSQITISTLKS